MTFFLTSCAWKHAPPCSRPHFCPLVPCKAPVIRNKWPWLPMGQNNTETSLFHCNWSSAGKHESIVPIIAVSPTPPRFHHHDSFDSFHLSTDYCLHVSMFYRPMGCMVNRSMLHDMIGPLYFSVLYLKPSNQCSLPYCASTITVTSCWMNSSTQENPEMHF